MTQRLQLFLILCSGYFAACRTTRHVVDVMDEKTPKTEAPEDFLHRDSTEKTTFVLTGISIPRQFQTHDRLDITLQALDFSPEIFQEDYKIGESIRIKPYTDYALVIRAFRNNREVYSSKTCSIPLKIRSDLGANRITAPLCSLATVQ